MDGTEAAEADGTGSTLQRLVRRAIRDWTRQLVDVSGRNTLLSFRPLKAGTLDLARASEEGTTALLFGEKVRISDAFGEEAGDAIRRCRAIKARADENDEERGLRTLSVAWGMASWTNSVSTYTPHAPVLLCHADLQPRGGAADDFDLQLGETEWEINPVLLHVLASNFDVRIEADNLLDLLGEDTDLPDGQAVFDRLTKECADIEGFECRPRLVLATFSYAKLPMVKDLEVAEELVLENTLLCAIAGDEGAIEELRNRHGEVAPNAPDFTPPSDEFLVLDADSSQSYAINSIVAGHDLVIEGPPGTGKSQTIANLIATLSARGKSVLFVAEKRAAIDAVLDRLRDKGLAELVLDMHDGPGAKRKLAQDLKKSIDDISAARVLDMTVEQEQLVHRRDALIAHTEAMHKQDPRWAISPFELLCELIGIPESSQSEQRFGSRALAALDAETYRRLQESVEQFIAIGGFSIATADNPWLAALEAGTITTPEEAAAVSEAMTNFTQHTLPEATSRIERTLGSVGLRGPDTLAGWVRTIELLRRTQETLTLLTPAAFDLNLAATALALVPAAGGAFGRFWHGLFDGSYRRALKATRATAVDPKAKAPDLLNALESAQGLIADWRAVSHDDGLPRLPEGLELAEGSLAQLSAELGYLQGALGHAEFEALRPEQLEMRLRVFMAERTTLNRLPELWRLSNVFDASHMRRLVSEMQARNLTAQQAAECLSFVWHSSVLETLTLHDPQLANFDGPAHSRVLEEFRKADVRHIKTTPARIKRKVAEHVVAVQNAYPQESALVLREAAKKTRHIPVRKLFNGAPHVLSALKPCWAMSPLYVSQLLPPTVCFDVVIFDEASQVTPESAVGALMRAEQAVVAGDPKQLPPTSFFASGSSQDDEDEEEYNDEPVDASAAMTGGYDSILGVMEALLPPPVGTKRLLWHYRSQDERLIAFSNSQPGLYDWSLTTFPGSGSGDVVTHELVPFVEGRVGQEDSVSDEVAAVVRAVATHARAHPDESLGVITMGIKHMNRIEEALRAARKRDSLLSAYMDRIFRENEKFFVKNLERVQGDERDAILISIGYGKSSDGRMLYRFGPINQEGGERRLNVAVTRARSRIGVISSFSSSDMDPARLRSAGAQMLRDYIAYCESGGTDLGARTRPSIELNPFERDVRTHLTAAGLDLECQVGASGFWIDFAAKHPTKPGRYVLAIEADGAMYHASPTARDRDRLRQDHLERLGWKFHRIWSTEWFHHREREVSRTMAAFEAALAEPPVLHSAPPPESAKHATEDVTAPGPRPAVRALPKPWNPDGRDIDEYPDFELVKFMRWIMSDDVLRTRGELIAIGTKELGFQRRGSKIVAALGRAIDIIERSKERS
jgi:very-short-patch-repair endonuclease